MGELMSIVAMFVGVFVSAVAGAVMLSLVFRIINKWID